MSGHYYGNTSMASHQYYPAGEGGGGGGLMPQVYQAYPQNNSHQMPNYHGPLMSCAQVSASYGQPYVSPNSFYPNTNGALSPETTNLPYAQSKHTSKTSPRSLPASTQSSSFKVPQTHPSQFNPSSTSTTPYTNSKGSPSLICPTSSTNNSSFKVPQLTHSKNTTRTTLSSGPESSMEATSNSRSFRVLQSLVSSPAPSSNSSPASTSTNTTRQATSTESVNGTVNDLTVHLNWNDTSAADHAMAELAEMNKEDYFYMETESRYCCTKCDYNSPRVNKLVEHIKAHLKGTYMCNICGKAFIKSSDMHRHAKSHQNNRTRSEKGYTGPPQDNLNLKRKNSEGPLIIEPISKQKAVIPDNSDFNGTNRPVPRSTQCSPSQSSNNTPIDQTSSGFGAFKPYPQNTSQACTRSPSGNDEPGIIVRATSVLSAQPLEIKPLDDSEHLPYGMAFTDASIKDPSSCHIGNQANKAQPGDDLGGLPQKQSVGAIKKMLDMRNTHNQQTTPAGSKQHLVCHLCNYTTKNHWHFEKHLLAHTKLSHTCSFCGKAFERSADLARHEERHKSFILKGGNPYEPLLSPPLLSEEGSVAIHQSISSALGISETFCCDQCGAKFTSETKLKKHSANNHIQNVIRVDEYVSNVLTSTQLLDCKLSENNVITLNFGPSDVTKALEDGLVIPEVSHITTGCELVDNIKRGGLANEAALMERAQYILDLEQRLLEEPVSVSQNPPVLTVNGIGDNEVSIMDISNLTETFNSPFRTLLASRHAEHMKSASGGHIFTCDLCNYSTNVKIKFEEHQRAHSGPFVCKICNKAFCKGADLTRHWVGHETIPGSPYIACDSCEFTSLDKRTMDHHMRDHYRIVGRTAAEDQLISGNSSFSEMQNGGSSLQSILDDSSNSLPEAPSESNGAKDNPPETKLEEDGLNINKKSLYKCRYCSKELFTVPELVEHENTHEKKKFKKEITVIPVFVKKAKSHLTKIESSKTQSENNNEGKKTSRKANTKKHMDNGDFTCKHCEESFTSLNVYQKHMKFHSLTSGIALVKTAECHFCSEEFVSAQLLKKHIKSMH